MRRFASLPYFENDIQSGGNRFHSRHVYDCFYIKRMSNGARESGKKCDRMNNGCVLCVLSSFLYVCEIDVIEMFLQLCFELQELL